MKLSLITAQTIPMMNRKALEEARQTLQNAADNHTNRTKLNLVLQTLEGLGDRQGPPRLEDYLG